MSEMSTPMASTSTLNEPERVTSRGLDIPDGPHAEDFGTPSANLAPGCTFGPTLYQTPRGIVSGFQDESQTSTGVTTEEKEPGEPIKIIWVEFPPNSPENPFSYSKTRKRATMTCALFFAFMTAMQASIYAPGIPSMQKDLGTTDLQAAAGISLYPWGFSIGPLILAPITEEYGRYWAYIGSVVSYTLLLLTQSLAQNTATVLVGRFLMGLAGCIGSSIVAGTVSDLYIPEHRGAPMSLFTACVVVAPGLAAISAYIEANSRLQWRWIGWVQFIIMGVYAVFVAFIMRETRSTVLLRRRAKKLRNERGLKDGGRYTARTEVDKPPLLTSLKTSMARPLMFLILEPIVTFFALWAALVWGVLFIEIAGLSYVFQNVFNFGTIASGSVFWCFVIGGILGYAINFYQNALYRRHYPKHGIEARLYVPMFSGILFAVGCIIFGLTAIPNVHWIGACIGIVILMTGAFSIYQTCFLYLSQCYGSHASSAVAGMSFLRIVVGSSFALFTDNLFDALTPRWGLFLMGGIALLLAPIPFIAYYKGPWIRERSPYSKILMAEEKKRIEAELQLIAKEDAEAGRPVDRVVSLAASIRRTTSIKVNVPHAR